MAKSKNTTSNSKGTPNKSTAKNSTKDSSNTRKIPTFTSSANDERRDGPGGE